MATTTTIKAGTSASKINTALKAGGTFVFKSGVYNLNKCLCVYSNTTIKCEDGVVFNRMHGGRMLQLKVDPSTTGYNGTHDVSWTGGKFVANTNSDNGIVIVVCHCRNITFDRVAVEGCVELHSFEINSSMNVKITNCTIKNQTALPGENHKEGIQIDFCYKGGLSIKNATETSPCYDGTHCEGISIIGCKFINCPSGIGTHTVSEAEEYHRNIVIANCDFNNIAKNSIRLLGMKDVTISNCNGNVLVDKTKKAHKVVGGKVTLANYRMNLDVTIDKIKIS